MIIIKLQGGLGNQLFQIFTGYVCHLTGKRPFKILGDIKENNSYLEKYRRPLYFHSFLKHFSPYVLNKNNKIMSSLNNKSLRINYREKGFQYTEIPKFPKPRIVCLNGYFQSYKYFDRYRDKLLKLLGYQAFKDTLLNKLSEADIFNNEKTVSLHFRLGDYKKNPDFHNILPLEYYKKSLAHIVAKDETTHYQVIYFYEQEDKELIISHIDCLKTMFPQMTFREMSDHLEDWEQLVLMSCCHHNVIANSSFSWWGAYFNNNPDKIVCYPSKWFGRKGPQNTNDICPEKWNKIMV